MPETMYINEETDRRARMPATWEPPWPVVPGQLLTTSGICPDAGVMPHQVEKGDPWLDVRDGDLFTVMGVVPVDSLLYARTELPVVMHMRKLRLIEANQVTAWWLQEI